MNSIDTYKKPINIYKPARAIIAPEIILIQSEYLIMALKSIFDIKNAIISMVNENPPAKMAMFIIL